jgi:hypothetical protein
MVPSLYSRIGRNEPAKKDKGKQMATELNKVQTLALHKAVSAAKYSEINAAFPAGEYAGSFLARVSYKLKKGEAYEQAVPAKAKPWALLAVALSKLNGVTVESIVEAALSGEVDTAEIEERASVAMEKLKGTTVTPCAGKLTGKVEAVEVEAAMVVVE